MVKKCTNFAFKAGVIEEHLHQNSYDFQSLDERQQVDRMIDLIKLETHFVNASLVFVIAFLSLLCILYQ
jgi:hypothetical protein